MRLYSMPSSGNSYKVRLLLALLGRAIETTDVEYLTEALEGAKASGRLPFGKAPVLELDDGRLLPESNAILCWLGEGTGFVPADPFARAEMLSWMFWEQNQHEGVIAVRAALLTYPHRRAQATPGSERAGSRASASSAPAATAARGRTRTARAALSGLEPPPLSVGRSRGCSAPRRAPGLEPRPAPGRPRRRGRARRR